MMYGEAISELDYDDFEGDEGPAIHEHACAQCGMPWECSCDDPQEWQGPDLCEDCDTDLG